MPQPGSFIWDICDSWQPNTPAWRGKSASWRKNSAWLLSHRAGGGHNSGGDCGDSSLPALGREGQSGLDGVSFVPEDAAKRTAVLSLLQRKADQLLKNGNPAIVRDSLRSDS